MKINTFKSGSDLVCNLQSNVWSYQINLVEYKYNICLYNIVKSNCTVTENENMQVKFKNLNCT